jgi:hypothetical protein
MVSAGSMLKHRLGALILARTGRGFSKIPQRAEKFGQASVIVLAKAVPILPTAKTQRIYNPPRCGS